MSSDHGNSIIVAIHHPSPHAIDRSTELLSVARTALCIAQQQQQQQQQQQLEQDVTNENESSTNWILSMKTSDLTLHNPNNNNIHTHINNTARELLSEAVLTLNHLDETLKKLSKLVKRRGHTNDPTNDINLAMCDFQSLVKDIMEVINTTLPQAAALPLSISNSTSSTSRVLSSSQRRKHYDHAAKILKQSVEVRMEQFKNVMKVRGDVIKDLTLRRERLLKKSGANVAGSGVAGSIDQLSSSNGMNNIGHNNRIMNRMNGGTNTMTNNAPLKQNPSVMEPKNVKSQLNSPLFTMSSPTMSNPYAKSNLKTSSSYKPSYQSRTNANYNGNGNGNGNPYSRKPMTTTSTSKTHASSYGSSGGYGGGGGAAAAAASGGYGYNAAGYGGYNNSLSNSTGMRHRGGNMNTTTSNHNTYNNNNNNNNSSYNPYQMEEEIKVHDKNNSDDTNIQTQIQKRRQARQTQNRLDSARMAEKTLAELTSMFGKMSHLIQSQGETLEKIEDDVEVAMGYVDDGYEEVGKLHDWKQGNRGLIIKCFGILIFVVIFMRYYG